MRKRELRRHNRAARFNVPLKEGVIGRRNQKTIRGPNGQLMSMSAAAKMAGVAVRTVIGRIQKGIDEKLWFHRGNLKRKNQAPAGRVIVAKPGKRNIANGSVRPLLERKRKKEQRRRDRLKLARQALAGPGPA